MFRRRGPAWLVPLLIFTFFAALLIANVLDSRSRVSGHLFECSECSRQRQRMRGAAVAVWVAFVLTFALALRNDALMVPAMLLLVAAPVASFALPRRAVVQGWLTRDRQGIVLSPVAPAFVTAVQSTLA